MPGLTLRAAPAEFDVHGIAHGADGLFTLWPRPPGWHSEAELMLARMGPGLSRAVAPVAGAVDGDVVNLTARGQRLDGHVVGFDHENEDGRRGAASSVPGSLT